MEKRKREVFRKIMRISLMALGIALMWGCSSGKYLSGFKPKDSHIETLTILNQYVYVKSKTEKINQEDTLLGTTVRNVIATEAESKISSKFALISPPDTVFDSSSKGDFKNLFTKLDNLKSTSAKVPYFLEPICDSASTRYIVLICFESTYDPRYTPYGDYKNSMAMGTALGGAVMTVPLTGKSGLRSVMWVLVLDNQNWNIVYYRKKTSTQTDPRIPQQIIEMTSDLVKPIYYWK